MTFDLVIKNATIIDGTGAPAMRADIGIAGGKISGTGKFLGAARRTIDASGLVARRALDL